jgi:hypothetical protein
LLTIFFSCRRISFDRVARVLIFRYEYRQNENQMNLIRTRDKIAIIIRLDDQKLQRTLHDLKSLRFFSNYTSANSETANKLNFDEISGNQRIQRKSAGTTNHIFDTSEISEFSGNQRVRRIISSTHQILILFENQNINI